MTNDAPHLTNSRAWDALARHDDGLTRPARDEDFADPLGTVDPLGWIGRDIRGKRLLCLAAGGGRQGPLYAAAGAEVTVLDISREMLARDRAVAAERRLNIRVVEGSMDDLSMFAPGEFDVVIHPVSTCYVPDVAAVYVEVARVVRGGGLYVSQHKSPVSLQAEITPTGEGYRLVEPYYRKGPLAPARVPSGCGRLRERGTHEYLHRWEQLIGNLCRAGFVIEDLVEPHHAKPHADRGTFAHRACTIAPYVRIKARRSGKVVPAKSIR